MIFQILFAGSSILGSYYSHY